MSQKAKLESIGPIKIDRSKPLKIFVKGVNWVGDAVMATPALATLRQTFPDSQITLMVRPWVAPIYDHNPDVTHLWVMDDAASPGSFLKAVKTVAAQHFTIGVALPSSIRSALLLALGGVKYRFGYSRRGRGLLLNRAVKLRREYLETHQVYYYLHILEEMCGKPAHKQQMVLNSGELEREEVRRLLAQLGLDRGQPLVGLAPGSINSEAKRWPAERFAALAGRLAQEARAEVLLLGSPREAEVLDRVEKQCPAKVHNLKDKVTLGQLIALLERVSGLICNDSGAMHLGAALGTPTVAVFGPTEFTTTYPFSNTARIARTPVDCAPCMLRECPTDHKCMTGVEVDDVFQAFKQIIQEAREKRAPRKDS